MSDITLMGALLKPYDVYAAAVPAAVCVQTQRAAGPAVLPAGLHPLPVPRRAMLPTALSAMLPAVRAPPPARQDLRNALQRLRPPVAVVVARPLPADYG